MNNQIKLNLKQAVMSAMECTDDLSGTDFIATPDELKATASLWMYLTGVKQDCELAEIVRNEALSDKELVIMLNTPARIFVDWFRREDWEFFELGEATDSDAWAHTVLERARALCNELRPLDLQVAMRLPTMN